MSRESRMPAGILLIVLPSVMYGGLTLLVLLIGNAPGYSDNPIVNAMCVGLVEHDRLRRARADRSADLVLLVGADTGRDGIQGATFASLKRSGSRVTCILLVMSHLCFLFRLRNCEIRA